MNFIRLYNQDGCLGGQESDGFDCGVLDPRFSNRRAKINEDVRHLNGETER